MDVVASIGSAIKLCSTASSIATELKHADLKLAIAELKEQLADAKEAALELRETVRGLEEEIATLKCPDLVPKDGKYFKQNGDGPFCTGCYDSSNRLIRLNPMAELFDDFGKWRCPVCKSHLD